MASQNYIDIIKGGAQAYMGYQTGDPNMMMQGANTALFGGGSGTVQGSGGFGGLGSIGGISIPSMGGMGGNTQTPAQGNSSAITDNAGNHGFSVDIREPVFIMGAFLLAAVGLLIAAGGSK